MAGMAKELEVALRGLLRRPLYTILALATLVLGVGSVTAAYGLLHQVVLRPLPFQDADRLVALRTLYDTDTFGLTLPEYLEVREHARVFESTAALVEPNLDTDWIWTGTSSPEVLSAVRVTDGFFSTLGVVPELGALPREGTRGERRVVVSRGFWQRRLGGDPSVAGTVLRITAIRTSWRPFSPGRSNSPWARIPWMCGFYSAPSRSSSGLNCP